MFTVIFIGTIISATICIKAKSKSSKPLFFVSLVFLALTIVGSAVSMIASADNLPDGYERVAYYYADARGAVVEDTTKLIRHEDDFRICVSSGVLLYWIPGYHYNYVPYIPSSAHCEHCDIVCELPYCVRCGTTLIERCNHKSSAGLPYCGDCGESLNSDQ